MPCHAPAQLVDMWRVQRRDTDPRLRVLARTHWAKWRSRASRDFPRKSRYRSPYDYTSPPKIGPGVRPGRSFPFLFISASVRHPPRLFLPSFISILFRVDCFIPLFQSRSSLAYSDIAAQFVPASSVVLFRGAAGGSYSLQLPFLIDFFTFSPCFHFQFFACTDPDAQHESLLLQLC